MKSQSSSVYRSLAERLLSAERVAVLTGAGVSRESGVPTFREKDGLWNKYSPEELANVEAFISNPERVWEWYNWRRELISKVKPNPGHYALAEMEKLLPHFVIITQNVDNLHFEAGSKNVIELHGNILRNKCHQCGRRAGAEKLGFEKGLLPHCDCGGLIRPDVVWFGEMLPEEALRQADHETSQSDVFFSIGTSSAVYPAAALPYQAKNYGAYLVEINPQKTELTQHADIYLQEPSGKHW